MDSIPCLFPAADSQYVISSFLTRSFEIPRATHLGILREGLGLKKLSAFPFLVVHRLFHWLQFPDGPESTSE